MPHSKAQLSYSLRLWAAEAACVILQWQRLPP